MKLGFQAALAAGAILASTASWATLQVSIGNGAASLTCKDGQACDLSGPANNVLVLNQTVGNFLIEGNFASSSKDTLSDSNLTITNLGTTTQTLNIAVSQTGFAFPVSHINESGSGTVLGSIGTSGSLSFHADTANGQGADTPTDTPGTLLFNPSATFSTDPFAFEGNHTSAFSANAPFSQTLDYTFTVKPGGSIVGLESAMTAAVPEPSTWVMIISAFGLMGAYGFKRTRKDRLAPAL